MDKNVLFFELYSHRKWYKLLQNRYIMVSNIIFFFFFLLGLRLQRLRSLAFKVGMVGIPRNESYDHHKSTSSWKIIISIIVFK